MKEKHLQTWLKKPQHDHLFRSHQDNNQVNESATNLRLKKSPISSHVEGYLLATKKSCLLLILKCSQLGLIFLNMFRSFLVLQFLSFLMYYF